MNQIDKRRNKNTVYIVGIVAILIITGVLSFSFAYIGGPTGNGKFNLTGNILDAQDGLKLTYSKSGDFTFDITEDMLSIENVGRLMYEEIGGIVVTLNSDAEFYPNGATCFLSFEYHPQNVYQGGFENAFKILYLGNQYYVEGQSPVDYDSAISIVSVFDPITIYEGSISTTSAGSSISNVYRFAMGVQVEDADQGELIGEVVNGKIVVVPGECVKN